MIAEIDTDASGTVDFDGNYTLTITVNTQTHAKEHFQSISSNKKVQQLLS